MQVGWSLASESKWDMWDTLGWIFWPENGAKLIGVVDLNDVTCPDDRKMVADDSSVHNCFI